MIKLILDALTYMLIAFLVSGIVVGCVAFVLAADYLKIQDSKANGGEAL